MAFRSGSKRQRIGWRREEAALQYLTAQGLRAVLRNYQCRAGEIDLVMIDSEVLVSVEVRFRSSHSHGGALASIDTYKQRRWIRATEYLLSTSPKLAQRCVRFDVVALQGEQADIVWLKDVIRL
ncbi:MAG: YraN family protein [Pseudomonadota bacterium]